MCIPWQVSYKKLAVKPVGNDNRARTLYVDVLDCKRSSSIDGLLKSDTTHAMTPNLPLEAGPEPGPYLTTDIRLTVLLPEWLPCPPLVPGQCWRATELSVHPNKTSSLTGARAGIFQRSTSYLSYTLVTSRRPWPCRWPLGRQVFGAEYFSNRSRL